MCCHVQPSGAEAEERQSTEGTALHSEPSLLPEFNTENLKMQIPTADTENATRYSRSKTTVSRMV